MKNYKYKFSVVIPIYNVEDYLEETIKSVVNQTIGFKENIQMILVNDGSPDNSEVICKKYQDLYPENVIYIKQENAGVSAARNKGFEYAEGEYVNFLDSDDKWQVDDFKKVCKFFDEHNDEIDAVACMLEFFEAKKGTNHPLNPKFDSDRVVDIMEESCTLQMHCASCFIKRDAILAIDNKFDSNLKYGEDALFINKIILEKKKYGVMKSVHYFYRKRASENSALDVSKKRVAYYSSTLINFHKQIMNYTKKKFGKVIDYIQNVVIYDTQYRLYWTRNNVLSDKEYKEYIKLLRDVLSEIDDRIITNYDLGSIYKNLYMLKLKHKVKTSKYLSLKVSDDKVYFKDNFVSDIYNLHCFMNNIKIKDDKLILYGQIFDLFKNAKMFLVDENNKEYEFNFYELDSKNKNYTVFDPSCTLTKKGISLELDLKGIKELRPMLKIKDELYPIKMNFSHNSRLNNTFDNLFLTGNNIIFKYEDSSGKFLIRKNSFKNRFWLEAKLAFRLVKEKRLKSLFVREFAKICRGFKSRDIWIISDRIQVAGDNGEAFFKYVMNNELNPDDKYYFAIRKKTKDYKRLNEEFSNVINCRGLRYKILFLMADYVVSAQADDYIVNPFGKSKKYVSDMYNHKFVFLQHGVTKDDLSPWLNVNNKSIDMFVTATNGEHQSMFDYRYNFSEDVPKLTGLSRYDLLMQNDRELKNQIVIMPTWRNSLVSQIDRRTGKREYDDEFKETEYFKFYNSLINDKRILNLARKKGYKIRFIPHVNMAQQIKDFDKNDLVEIVNKDVVYRDEFKTNKLLVTDYSSVYFDFAYLKKPVIYAQFDQKEFFEGQIYDKGYFDYDKDGFGPVCTNYESTVKAIVKALKNDCVLDKKYEKRIDNCFKYHDENNSKRIYDEIKKL